MNKNIPIEVGQEALPPRLAPVSKRKLKILVVYANHGG